MIGAALLRRLAALRLPTEAFQEVLSIIADMQASDETRREKSRQRTSRWRHSDATVTTLERHNDSHIPPRAYTTPPKKINSKKNLSIPDGFSADLDFATARGWSREYAQSEAQRFRDHALAKDRKAKDWQAAWRNWVTSPFQKTTPSNGVSNGSDPFERQPGESLGHLAGRLADEARKREREAGVTREDDPVGSH